MTDSFFNREIPREPNYGIPYAIYLVLRRQPWKQMASTTWGRLKRLFLLGAARSLDQRHSGARPPQP